MPILPDYGMLISSIRRMLRMLYIRFIRRMLRMLFIRIIRYNSSNVYH